MSMLHQLGEQVSRLHDTTLNAAEGPPVAQPASAIDTDRAAQLWHWIHTNHFFNSSLWAEEDLARRSTVSAEEIAQNKRAIDKLVAFVK